MAQRKPYPSDINRDQFEQIRPLLESVRKRTKPCTVDLHEVFNAVLYLLKSGCQWRMLPEGFPNWVMVYSYFAKWSAPGADVVSALERAPESLTQAKSAGSSSRRSFPCSNRHQAAHSGPLRSLLRGVYLLKSGCQRRMLPRDFPKWRTVQSFFPVE